MPSSTRLDLSHVRLLIADRQRNMITLLAAMVRGFGVRSLHTTQDADTAIDHMAGGIVNCALIDDMLDGIDALDIAQAVRQDTTPGELSILLATATPTRRRIKAARNAGVDLVLARPFSALDLYLRIGVLVTVFNAPNEGLLPPDAEDMARDVTPSLGPSTQKHDILVV